MMSPAEFVSQVRKELQRVTWPTQGETMGMTMAVILMIICAMIYLFVADGVIYYLLRKILGI
ncbi:MAG: preprotein translocase subunit SecE [Holosporaceae bacterium]|jgi:preprotein translocase subunit SecE|nr:preprotein translocase subunit SecE [Holosporaceae bacterium]